MRGGGDMGERCVREVWERVSILTPLLGCQIASLIGVVTLSSREKNESVRNASGERDEANHFSRLTLTDLHFTLTTLKETPNDCHIHDSS